MLVYYIEYLKNILNLFKLFYNIFSNLFASSIENLFLSLLSVFFKSIILKHVLYTKYPSKI